MGRPRSDLARDTRRELLDAALDLFAERGYHATSMRALAGAVGVRESAIYHHFASKDALLEAVVTEHASARAAVAERVLAEVGDQPLARILSVAGEAILAQLSLPRERKFIRLAMSLGDQLADEHSPFRRLVGGNRSAFGRLVTELQRTGRLRRDVDTELLMTHFAMPLLVASGALWGGRSPLKLPLKKFLKAHVALMVRAAGRKSRET